MTRWICLLLLICFAAPPKAEASLTPAQQQQFQSLAKEIRCLVCQNQSLADSEAELATDLRQEITTMIEQGKADDDIKEYLVERYGEFILYRPRLNEKTLLLWIAPFILLGLGLGIVTAKIMRKAQRQHRPLSAEEEKRIAALLKEKR